MRIGRDGTSVTKDDLYTIDVWPQGEQADGSIHYRVALSGLGTRRTADRAAVGTSHPLVSGTVVLYPGDGERFEVVGDTLRFPPGVSAAQASAILAAIFEQAGRGAAVDEDWVWLPIDLRAFLTAVFGAESASRQPARPAGRSEVS